MYGGWHQYMGKDLRTLLGERVRGRFNVRYCGRGNLERCAADLWAAIERGARAAAASQGTSDPARWSSADRDDLVHAAAAHDDPVHEPPERHPLDPPVQSVTATIVVSIPYAGVEATLVTP